MEIQEDMISWEDKPELRPEINEGERSKSSGPLKSKICLDSHTGTHVDAPKHFLSDGGSIDRVPLDKLIGECMVLDCRNREKEVRAEDIEDYDVDIILLRTRNSELLSKKDFDEEYVYVNENACRMIVNYGYEAVGIDYLGIGEFGNSRPAHEGLLGNGVIIIGGLDLLNI